MTESCGVKALLLRLGAIGIFLLVGVLLAASSGGDGDQGETEENEAAAESQEEQRSDKGTTKGASWQGERISLSLRDADLRDVLLSFAELADVNMVIDPDIQGKVTVELQDVPWGQALAVILKSQGLGVEISQRRNRLWRISREPRGLRGP